jgi:hypothetical protein
MAYIRKYTPILDTPDYIETPKTIIKKPKDGDGENELVNYGGRWVSKKTLDKNRNKQLNREYL